MKKLYLSKNKYFKTNLRFHKRKRATAHGIGAVPPKDGTYPPAVPAGGLVATRPLYSLFVSAEQTPAVRSTNPATKSFQKSFSIKDGDMPNPNKKVVF